MARSNRILSFTIRAGVMTGLLCGVPGTGVAQTPRPTQAGPASPGTGAGVFAQEDPAPGRSVPLPQGTGAGIVAIVNGDVISEGDVANRRKLFALSSGLPASQDVLNRLTPRIISQLIDERLRLQEMQRRHIVVGDAEIAAAIKDVEQRNGMAPGTLQSRLAAAGVGPQTLIDQLRVQLGWGRVLRQQIGASFDVSDSDIAEQIAALKAQTGQTEFQVGEIFVPVEGPTAKDESRKFVDTIIQELRAGAPFAVAAAQFSQSQTALQGGDLGWIQSSQLDPEVVHVLQTMPIGAVSNPIKVPGGYSIVTLRGKREIGHDVVSELRVRQAFLPFSTPLDPRAPTEQQKQTLDAAKSISASAHDCDAIEAANTRYGAVRKSDPGPVQLDALAPALRAVVEKLHPLQASQPLVAQDGIALVMVCSRDDKVGALPNRAELSARILSDRIELASRQLMRDLQRRALIEQRS